MCVWQLSLRFIKCRVYRDKKWMDLPKQKTVDVLAFKYEDPDTTVDELNRQATRVVKAVEEAIARIQKKGMSHSQNTRITHATSQTESRIPRKALYNV